MINWEEQFASNDAIKFVAYGVEKCPESKREHHQGFLQLQTKQRLSFLKKLAPKVHWEGQRGSFADNEKYCSKEGAYRKFGEFSQQGRRIDIEAVKCMVENGSSNLSIINAHPVTAYRCHAAIEWHRKALNTRIENANYDLKDFPQWAPITDWSKSHVLYGDPGIGKTEFALAHFKRALFVTHMNDLAHLGDHDGIIFDDMSFCHIPREACVQLVDMKQTRSIHIRYSTATIPRFTRKIFLTNALGGTIFTDQEHDAIQRRVIFTLLNKFQFNYPVCLCMISDVEVLFGDSHLGSHFSRTPAGSSSWVRSR